MEEEGRKKMHEAVEYEALQATASQNDCTVGQSEEEEREKRSRRTAGRHLKQTNVKAKKNQNEEGRKGCCGVKRELGSY